MLFVQKYHCATQIDPEFIAPLEDLLCEHIPCFDWIKEQESLAPPQCTFTYYLFFSKSNNSPVGLAMHETVYQDLLHTPEEPTKDKSKTRSFFLEIFKRKSVQSSLVKSKSINWKMVNQSDQGIFFNPRYAQIGLKELSKIINEYSLREDIKSQTITVNSVDMKLLDLKSVNEKNDKKFTKSLIKTAPDFKSYFQGLKVGIKKDLMASWKNFLAELNISEHSSLKDCFAYKEHGADQYKSLRQNEKFKTFVKNYQSFTDNFISLSSETRVFAIIFFIRGKKSHVFFDALTFDEKITERMILQVAIMSFYDKEDLKYLHPLRESSDTSLAEDFDLRLIQNTDITVKHL